MHEHPCGSCRFHQDSVWQPVASEGVSALLRNFSRSKLDAGELLYRQGDKNNGVYCVSAGLIAVRTYDADGASTLLRLVNPGELIGYRAFLTGRSHRTEAQALVKSRVCRVAMHGARKVMDGNPDVMARLARRCALDLDLYQERIQASGRQKNRARLMEILTGLMAAHGTPDGDYLRMRLPVSRRDLADMMGVQPETMSRLLGRLEQDGVLRASGRMIEMPRQSIANYPLSAS